MKGMFTFLGTGASAGVPVIGCKCAVCTSKSPRNQRFRPSGLIHIDGKSLLLDIGPDFRSQALQFGIDDIDGLLLTHTHYDHIAGIDEIRIFNNRKEKAIPCLLSRESFGEIEKRYYYLFKQEGCAKLEFCPLDDDFGKTDFLGIPIEYVTFLQSRMKVTGYRIGDFAYISDIQKYDDQIFAPLQGVKKLVLSALRPEPSPFHLSFAEATSFAKRVGAQETWITHLGHFLDHEAYNDLLPSQIRVAYDGLKLEFTCTK